ncbi:MAG: bifunctional phosphoglucose/phosphomannose isomerase [Candidatus Bathyarchaeia archaeon]
MVRPLDDQRIIDEMDPGGMLGELRRFPEACREAIATAEEVALPFKAHDIHNILVVGMGGSAIGGMILKDWLEGCSKTPITTSRGHHIPGFVGPDSLTVAVSYSGNTLETLSSMREAIDAGSRVVAVTSGGEMLRIARENQIPTIPLPGGKQPRAAFPYQFFTLATLARRIGVASEIWHEVDRAIELLRGLRSSYWEETPARDNPAKQLAMEIRGYIPIFYGSRLLRSVAYRYRTQFNENSKSPASSSFMPEALHNAVMSREAEEGLLSGLCAVLIRDPLDGLNREREERFRELLEGRYGKTLEVQASGEGGLERILSSIYLGDYASVYLGLLYGKDPSSTGSISILKGS